METSISIETILNDKSNYNLALPFTESRQLNPYFKMSVSLLHVDTGAESGQIFKVGSKVERQGNRETWVDLYSLTKPFLQRLATEAGIQFAPGAGDVVKVDENTWKASAFGALKLPDGTIRTSNNFKVIDLLTEEKKYRIAYAEKSRLGIKDYRQAKAASERFQGDWKETGEVDNRGYKVKSYLILSEDRDKYIEQSLLEAMAQLRAHAPQKAATGAILRVIRDLTGVKGTYTLTELKKPFAVARMSFSPDYNDPMVKQMLLQQCMQSMGNLFGNNTPITQTISIPQAFDIEEEVDMPEVEQQTADQATQYIEEPKEDSRGEKITLKENTEADRINDFCCDKCGIVIPRKAWDYSYNNLGLPLCYECQRKFKFEQRGNM